MAQFQEGYGQYHQSHNQDFFQTNYTIPEGEGPSFEGAPPGQQAWGGAVSSNQVYYAPAPGYDSQGYSQQQGKCCLEKGPDVLYMHEYIKASQA